MPKKIILYSLLFITLTFGCEFLYDNIDTNAIDSIDKQSLSKNWETNFFKSLFEALKALI
jgi:hypothetical protein